MERSTVIFISKIFLLIFAAQLSVFFLGELTSMFIRELFKNENISDKIENFTGKFVKITFYILLPILVICGLCALIIMIINLQ